MGNYQIDEIDRKILSFLVKDARMAYLEIARECGVSGAAIHQRVRKLEAGGVITGSRLLVKPSAIGLNVCAFVSISISEANKYKEVTESLKKIPEVVECHFVTGSTALLIRSVRASGLGEGLQYYRIQIKKAASSMSSGVVSFMLFLSPSM